MVPNRVGSSLDPFQYMNKNGSLNRDLHLDICTFIMHMVNILNGGNVSLSCSPLGLAHTHHQTLFPLLWDSLLCVLSKDLWRHKATHHLIIRCVDHTHISSHIALSIIFNSWVEYHQTWLIAYLTLLVLIKQLFLLLCYFKQCCHE